MNSAKNYKLMTGQEMITLLSESEILSVTGIAANGAHMGIPPNYYENAVREHRAKSTVIQASSRPVYRVIWERVFGNQISVLMVQSLSDDNNSLFLGQGLDALAKLENATAVLFSTARKSLITQCQTWGAEVFQVWLKKTYA